MRGSMRARSAGSTISAWMPMPFCSASVRSSVRPHGWGDPDERAGADEARLAAHRLAEALEDRERAEHHLARLGGIKLADDADGPAGAAEPRSPLEDHDALPAGARELERDRDACHAAADDDDIGRPGASAQDLTTAQVSTSPRFGWKEMGQRAGPTGEAPRAIRRPLGEQLPPRPDPAF